MTVERIEGAAEADNTAAEADASDASAGTDVSQASADETATADAESSANAAETTSPADAATPDDATPDDVATEATPAADAGQETPSATAEDGGAPADAGNGLGTADPSEEAAIGASGARSLGDATQVSDRVNDAVERMQAGIDAAAGADGDGAAPAASAVDASAAEYAPAHEELGADDAPAADEELGADDAPAAQVETPAADDTAAAAASAPAPRVYDGPEPTTMEELLNEQATEIRSLKHGDVVEGNVVRIDKDEILVDIGAKSEGVISNRELYGRNAETQPQLNIGDQVLVYVLQPESPEGHAVLSLRRAGLERKWRAMQEQLDAGAIIEAPVIDHNKGGLIVDCGIRGFVPISQIVDFPRRPQNEQPRDAAQEIAEKLQPYVGRKLRLKILEVNRKANRLILSEKVALYEERREKRDELFSSLQVGQKVTGSVRSIAPFGVFIDLGGIDGLVHKSELSWNKVNNPESGYRVGEEVEAEVIDINHERGRISLSIRRLQPDPWHSTVADLKVGDIIDGTVTKIVNFGAFVRVRDGLEGLIHISELSHARVAHPGDVVHEGQTIKLKIISLEQERHRLGLSLKQAEEAPARPERPAAPRGERRPRPERGYDASQAVQEPEGGIDNTLAAAFAQVRAQMEQTEAARSAVDYSEATEAPAADGTVAAPAEDAAADAPPADEAADAPPADEVADAPAADEASEAPAAELGDAPAADDAVAGTDEPEIAAETDDAPALEVGAAESSSDAGPPDGAATDEAPSADVDPVAAAGEADAAGDEQPPPTAEPAEGADEPSGEQLPASPSDPAEGADDAAPADGADREETAG